MEFPYGMIITDYSLFFKESSAFVLNAILIFIKFLLKTVMNIEIPNKNVPIKYIANLPIPPVSGRMNFIFSVFLIVIVPDVIAVLAGF